MHDLDCLFLGSKRGGGPVFNNNNKPWKVAIVVSQNPKKKWQKKERKKNNSSDTNRGHAFLKFLFFYQVHCVYLFPDCELWMYISLLLFYGYSHSPCSSAFFFQLQRCRMMGCREAGSAMVASPPPNSLPNLSTTPSVNWDAWLSSIVLTMAYISFPSFLCTVPFSLGCNLSALNTIFFSHVSKSVERQVRYLLAVH